MPHRENQPKGDAVGDRRTRKSLMTKINELRKEIQATTVSPVLRRSILDRIHNLEKKRLKVLVKKRKRKATTID